MSKSKRVENCQKLNCKTTAHFTNPPFELPTACAGLLGQIRFQVEARGIELSTTAS